MPTEDLKTFLYRQPATTLADLLLELAEDFPDVQKRLERLQVADNPSKLATAFRKTLAGWRRSQKYYDYKTVGAFASKLELWLDQVARELAPKDPAAALELLQAFIEADQIFFESADDSGAHIGDAVRKACRYWLKTAAQCETPEAVLAQRLMTLATADAYGAREGLFREAHLLLSEPAMRTLVADLERTMAALVAQHAGAPHMPYEVIKVSSGMSLIGEALKDPDVRVRAILGYRSDPNPLQKESMVQAYLEAERPKDAMKWLEGNWGHLDDRRQRLLAQAHAQLGQPELSHPLLQELFERSPSVEALRQWLDGLTPQQQVAAMERAGQGALAMSDPGRAAHLLVELHRESDAEAVLVEKAAAIDGMDYYRLPMLAKTLVDGGRLKGATAVYRALLINILERANTRAYGHAARYLESLTLMSREDLAPLATHEEFVALLREKHGRKASFWSLVAGG
ncbi:DUF6880 family protein [Roseateles sp. SL47]|uniref:DUF6880 family protein n=1 Tax=Roseateles sp. SL47 TaxID=2995138 RepID=UPI002D1E48EA|nr:DUF6880 family protein [Roseateles sp. SL47]